MNQVAVIEPRSVTVDMAHRFGMEAKAFEATLRATVFPANGTREQFASFLLVAKEYNLNPITKEIYAFPSKGGIVPIVGIDGWVKLVNSHPAFDGMEFTENHDDKGDLVSVTCKLWRKDRAKPVTVTEYLSECYRPTDAWKMKHRMLRHKTLNQAARYAFGFAGIYDPDENERIIEVPLPPEPPPDPEETRPVRSDPPPPSTFDFNEYRKLLAASTSLDQINETYETTMRAYTLTSEQQDEADAILREVAKPLWEAQQGK